MVAVLRRMLVDGLKSQTKSKGLAPEMKAAAAAGAIYGAVREWASTPKRVPAEEAVNQIIALIGPLVGLEPAAKPGRRSPAK
jgi:hypothetical protein